MEAGSLRIFQLNFYLIWLGCFGVILFGEPSSAVTQYGEESLNFVTDLDQLKPSLSNMRFSDSVKHINVPIKKLKIRAHKGKPDEVIEAISISIPKNVVALSDLVKRLAKKGKSVQLHKRFVKRLLDAGSTNKDSVKVYLDMTDLKYISASALSAHMARDHHRVVVKDLDFNRNQNKTKALLEQVSDFLPERKRQQLAQKIRAGIPLVVEDDLLPKFAENVIGKYLVFRGPNCFHAALAFHGQHLTKSKFINVKEEKGYHKAMINYDELWRAINKNFYEVHAATTPLRYGDMLVFFDVPTEKYEKISFRWIRHTATYLFGPYTFSKGSKSPDTPYTIKTVKEEWDTWLGFTAKLGVKVFRRNAENLQSKPPKDLIDWIY